MILYGSTLSPFVRKVMAFAGEKGIEIELQPTGFPDPSPDFCAASPFRKMPALKDGDFCLPDSSAIIHYLEAKYPEPLLIPTEPRDRGRAIWFDEFGDTILAGCGAKMFFNRVVSPIFLKRPGNEEVAEAAQREELPPILDYLEKVVPDEGGYLVGDRLSLADIAVAGPFANLGHLGIATDPARHPRTAAYVERILGRPSFSQWIERERALLAKVTEAA
ncbi:MAG TPA: glutathione S-transferase family protein [Sphingomicrobium sp.]|nr:glutathione S-transferase family protein [Sphingomicrobium sp.]